MLNIEKMIHIPLRDKAGNLTIRGIAWKMAEDGYWKWVDYGDFCLKAGLLPF